jgi:hypothetical protein
MKNNVNADVIGKATVFDNFYFLHKCTSTIFTGVVVTVIFPLMVSCDSRKGEMTAQATSAPVAVEAIPKIEQPPVATAVSPSSQSIPVVIEKKVKKTEGFHRSDEDDVGLKARPVNELVTMLKTADPALLKKVCKELGDRVLRAEAVLSIEQQVIVDDVVKGWMDGFGKLQLAQERSEVRQNLQRLWTLSAPALIPIVDSQDLVCAEAAVKSLIMMRNRNIIVALVARYQAITDPETKERVGFFLSKMTDSNASLVPGRPTMNERDTNALYNELIAPVIGDSPHN